MGAYVVQLLLIQINSQKPPSEKPIAFLFSFFCSYWTHRNWMFGFPFTFFQEFFLFVAFHESCSHTVLIMLSVLCDWNDICCFQSRYVQILIKIVPNGKFRMMEGMMYDVIHAVNMYKCICIDFIDPSKWEEFSFNVNQNEQWADSCREGGWRWNHSLYYNCTKIFLVNESNQPQ